MADKKRMQRVEKEFTRAQTSTIFKITRDITHSDVFTIKFSLNKGAYKGQTHVMQLLTYYDRKVNYPITPPDLKFVSKIMHPNVAGSGYICLDILQHNWSPQYTIEKIIISIILLLEEPNPSSPLNIDAARLYEKCTKLYNIMKRPYMPDAELSDLFNTCFAEYISTVNDHYYRENDINQLS
jgi:ubiquitin-protein ligase